MAEPNESMLVELAIDAKSDFGENVKVDHL